MPIDTKDPSAPGREGLLAAFRAVRDALIAGDVEALRVRKSEQALRVGVGQHRDDLAVHLLVGDG